MVSEEAQADLGYVRDLLRKSDRRATPASICLLWAAITLAGFASVDFFPRYTGLYWMICAPLGSLASALLGARHGLVRGQIDRRTGIRHALHWGGMLVITGLAVVASATGHLPRQQLSRVILLIVTLGWWTAGVHFDAVFLWLGGLLALGFVGTLVLPGYAWTALGAAIALGLTIIALRRSRTDVVAAR